MKTPNERTSGNGAVALWFHGCCGPFQSSALPGWWDLITATQPLTPGEAPFVTNSFIDWLDDGIVNRKAQTAYETFSRL